MTFQIPVGRIFPMVACVFIVMMQTGIRQFHLMIAVHKLYSTKLNSDKMPSQIYSWSAVLSSETETDELENN